MQEKPKSRNLKLRETKYFFVWGFCQDHKKGTYTEKS